MRVMRPCLSVEIHIVCYGKCGDGLEEMRIMNFRVDRHGDICTSSSSMLCGCNVSRGRVSLVLD